MDRKAFTLLLLCLAGCNSQPTMNIKTVDDIQPEIKRVSEKLEPAKAAEFKTAVEVLSLHVAQSATSEEGMKLAPVSALNGKTPDAIIAEYNKLDPQFRRQTGTAIAALRKERPTDFLRRANQKYDEFDQLRKGDLYVFDALGRIHSVYNYKIELEGELDAAKWYDQEMAKFTTIDELMREWGLEKGGPKVEEIEAKMKAAGKR